MRNVTVNSVEFNSKKVIATDVTTYGDLKKVLADNEISVANKSVIVAETKNHLEVDSAILPEGDFTIMIFPQTFKAGFYDSPEDYADYTNTELVEEIEEEQAQINAKVALLKQRLSNGGNCGECSSEVAPAQTVIPMTQEDIDLAAQLQREMGR